MLNVRRRFVRMRMRSMVPRLSATAATVLVVLIVACKAPRFEGGELRNVGLPLYPRFVATFEPLPLDQPGEFSFMFRRFPSAHAGVVLETPSRPDAQALEVLTTRVELSVTDQAGAVRCSGTGSPASDEPYRLVVWSNSGEARGLWHSGCSGVDVSLCEPCMLHVKVSGIDPRAPTLAVVPALHGRKK
jgi:hypothetical protein